MDGSDVKRRVEAMAKTAKRLKEQAEAYQRAVRGTGEVPDEPLPAQEPQGTPVGNMMPQGVDTQS